MAIKYGLMYAILEAESETEPWSPQQHIHSYNVYPTFQ